MQSLSGKKSKCEDKVIGGEKQRDCSRARETTAATAELLASPRRGQAANHHLGLFQGEEAQVTRREFAGRTSDGRPPNDRSTRPQPCCLVFVA
ncbi:hypothetical protein Aduo_008935 [Ancylostoma duodenale]